MSMCMHKPSIQNNIKILSSFYLKPLTVGVCGCGGVGVWGCAEVPQTTHCGGVWVWGCGGVGVCRGTSNHSLWGCVGVGVWGCGGVQRYLKPLTV